jgi:hypothetical protein
MAHLEQKLCPPRHTQQRHPLRITWRGCENLMAHSAAGRFFWSAANTFRSSRLGGEESDVAEAWPLLQESLKEKSLKDGLSNSMANKGWGFPTQGLVRMQSYLVSLTLNLPPPSLVLNHATLLLFSSLPLSFSLSFPPLFHLFSPSLCAGGRPGGSPSCSAAVKVGGAISFFFHGETSCCLVRWRGSRLRRT